ncbi:hypothetical protein [Streptomyces sp. 900105245]
MSTNSGTVKISGMDLEIDDGIVFYDRKPVGILDEQNDLSQLEIVTKKGVDYATFRVEVEDRGQVRFYLRLGGASGPYARITSSVLVMSITEAHPDAWSVVSINGVSTFRRTKTEPSEGE